MRVVAGRFGGHRLSAPSGKGTRPTSDRVREAIFSALSSVGNLAGARVLDLYAGSGACGIEALSRGACECVFVEKNPEAAKIIWENLVKLGLERCGKVERVGVEEYLRWASWKGEKGFHFVFADPPYTEPVRSSLFEFVSEVILPGGIFTVERAFRAQSFDDASVSRDGCRFRLHRSRRYGDTEVDIYLFDDTNCS